MNISHSLKPETSISSVSIVVLPVLIFFVPLVKNQVRSSYHHSGRGNWQIGCFFCCFMLFLWHWYILDPQALPKNGFPHRSWARPFLPSEGPLIEWMTKRRVAYEITPHINKYRCTYVKMKYAMCTMNMGDRDMDSSTIYIYMSNCWDISVCVCVHINFQFTFPGKKVMDTFARKMYMYIYIY